MYTKEQVDEVLSQVEQEFNKTLGSMNKSEETEEIVEEVEAKEEDLNKSEEVETEEVETEEYETIDELYASMSKNEKEAHYNSLKKVIFGEEVQEEEVQEEMNKSEEIVEEKEDEELKMMKSENEELKKNLNQMEELVSKLFSTKKAPAQKAITNVDYIAKSEQEEEKEDFSKMSKGEITSKLKSIDYGTLSKSDRNAINEFYLKNGSVDKIKHLIKE